ncbi:MAG: tRNA epoxyqueuosine(34) reductase QueG [Acidobacteriota bacterium]
MPPTKENLTARIKAQAETCGFDKVGIVAAEALSEEGARLRSWLARDYHGTMGWMARDPERRCDPRQWYPEARTALCAALNYYTADAIEDTPGTGKVSRYAWGDDYHDVVRDKLERLLEWIRREVPGGDGRIAVDTSPVMDKAWAVRAGLGWLGKHGNVITTDLGSWVFLGELFLNFELCYDTERVADHCGNCDLCLHACPTGAIVEDFVVDSNRCISYATIEYRGEDLPVDSHGWVFGCDVCQDVCPWNCFATASAEPRFLPRDGLVNPSLAPMVQQGETEFQDRFRGSAIRRTKAAGLQRNARAAQRRR